MSQTARIRIALDSDREELARMRASLWPEATFEEHLKELADVSLSESMPVNLMAEGEDGSPIGFLEVGLRSVADGCDTSRPVGYVEGWFVEEPYRNRGVGRALLRAAEDWARSQGCMEMASDALIDNLAGQQAHEAMGFEVVDRCVHYRKRL